MPTPDILSALTVPFSEGGEILWDAFDANIRRLEPFVDGAFVAGTTGEFLALEPEERLRLTRHALAVFGPDRVVVHAGAPSTRQAISIAEAARAVGAVRFAAITPIYLAADAAGTAAHYAALRAALPDVALYAYLFPEVAVTDILPVDFAQLLDAGIDGVKLSGLASTRVGEYLAVSPAGFPLWSGNDADLPAVLAAGGRGTVSGVSSVVPQPWADFRQARLDGDDVAEAAAQRQIQVAVGVLGPSISRLKYGLDRQGMIGGRCRMTIAPVDEPTSNAIDDALAELRVTEPAVV